MTKGELSREIAKHFAGVKAPNSQRLILVKVTDVNGIILSEKVSHALTLTYYDGQVTWGVATIQLREEAFRFVKQVFDTIGTSNFDRHIGEHRIDMRPLMVMLNVGT